MAEAEPGALLKAAVAAHQDGRPEAAIPLYEAALAQFPDAPARHATGLWLAAALCDADRRAEALEVCRAAVACDPEDPAGFSLLAGIALDLGRLDEARMAADAALRRYPDDTGVLDLATGIALARGEAEAAAAHAAASLARDPANQRALAHRIVALAQRQEDAELAELLDFDRLLRVATVAPPPGFASIDAFNAALSAALAARPDLDRRHIGKTMVGGARLHDSFGLEPRLAGALRGLFRREAQAYAEALAVAPHHPVRRGRPAEPWTEVSWANITAQAEFELPHIHDGSWLGAVYYAEMPEPDGEAGAIEFGGHDFAHPGFSAGPTRRILPTPGTMVLFPAYFYHRTLPFTGTGRRISIAYDVRRLAR
jgi:tetratricopeptide (TPR) repeat protein